MRHVAFIGFAGCGACDGILESVVKPLMERYPNNVSAHYGWDETIARVNKRKEITNVPLFVIENGGREDFRYVGRLGIEELAAIIECERDAISLDDVLGGGAM